MDINIRKAIIDNFKNFSSDELHQTINEAVKSKEEKILPGLGVFLELFWEDSTPGDREIFINKLLTKLK